MTENNTQAPQEESTRGEISPVNRGQWTTTRGGIGHFSDFVAPGPRMRQVPEWKTPDAITTPINPFQPEPWMLALLE